MQQHVDLLTAQKPTKLISEEAPSATLARRATSGVLKAAR